MGILKKISELSSSLIYQPDRACIELIKTKEFLLIWKKEKKIENKTHSHSYKYLNCI